MERIYVNNTCTLQRCDSYLLTLTLPDGQVLERLEPRLLFPITSGTTYANDHNHRLAIELHRREAITGDRQCQLICLFMFVVHNPIINITGSVDILNDSHLDVAPIP